MILLLGGTHETSALATMLAAAGHAVLVSTATDTPLDVGSHPGIRRRVGRLDPAAMADLARANGVRAIVDATHPYATAVRATAAAVARELGVPCLSWVRPPVLCDGPDLSFADTHDEAAALACGRGRPVLLTTGSRHLAPYVAEARRHGVVLVARVLDREESLAACREAGIDRRHCIAGRGPWSMEANRATIRQFGIGVLVTKDGGEAGGVTAKVEAARAEGCEVVVVRRPRETAEVGWDSLEALAQDVGAAVAESVGP